MQLAIDIALSLIYFSLFLLLCAWSWRFWMMYINQQHLNKLNWVMLEIKLPREILKSPLATEVAINSLLQGGGLPTKFHRMFLGNLPIFSSLEVASIEGVIHFYVRIQGKFRTLVESNFYAQYPGIEIIEADDYTSLIRYEHKTKDVSMWGARFKLTQMWEPYDVEKGAKYEEKGKSYEMPADFLPLKTYVDYGLDKDPKEEFKIDPITPMLEFMGSIGKGEHFWFQIIMADEKVFNGTKMPKFYVNKKAHEHLSLSDMAKKYKNELKISGFKVKDDPVTDEVTGGVKKKPVTDAEGKTTQVEILQEKTRPEYKKEMDLTAEEKDKIESVNRKLSKPLALSVIRMVYIAKKESFNHQNIMSILSYPKPYTGANSLGPTKTTDPYNFPWENFRNRRIPWRQEEMFEEYVEREGFFPHVEERTGLDRWEDSVFWNSSMKNRKLFRMIYEGIFHPFSHPHPDDAITLNLEEIATLWHLPGAVATTPTLPRIDSAKGVAPVNLPQ